MDLNSKEKLRPFWGEFTQENLEKLLSGKMTDREYLVSNSSNSILDSSDLVLGLKSSFERLCEGPWFSTKLIQIEKSSWNALRSCLSSLFLLPKAMDSDLV